MTSPTSTIATWRSRPVFISSTFKDMHAERDYLRHHVFPRLEEELRKRHHHLEPIDLRIGVETCETDTEEARELLVLKVCLDEIERSRPFLLVLLGDRYGWVPHIDLMATAVREQGMETDLLGKSVTALEIEFGILKKDPAQRRRTLFFFRDPLPYNEMPGMLRERYSDAYSSDPVVRQGFENLRALKEWLATDPELGVNVFRYSATWDKDAERVAGLEEFGNMVFAKLWHAIDEETRGYITQIPQSVAEQESAALAEFIEDRALGLVGREAVLCEILELASSTSQDDSPWGVAIMGETGCGKSALLAQLTKSLKNNDSVVVLAAANQACMQDSPVNSTLRRWTYELADLAKIVCAVPEQADYDLIMRSFAGILREVASLRRVILLFDDLDKPLGAKLSAFLKSFRHSCSENVILVFTADERQHGFMELPEGIRQIAIPPLTEEEAAMLAINVWRRYHRACPREVLEIVLGKHYGKPCGASNPLWLTIAMEQVNLLDADDFAGLEGNVGRSVEEKLLILLKDFVGAIPSDLEGLFRAVLSRMERAHGSVWVRAFSFLIACSGQGWREIDLQSLLPPIANALDPRIASDADCTLKLAALRRSFRGVLVQGRSGLWDFACEEFKRATLFGDEQILEYANEVVFSYVRELPIGDQLRAREFVHKAIACAAYEDIGRYLASDLGDQEESLALHTFGEVVELADRLSRTGARASEGNELFNSILEVVIIDRLGERERQLLLSRLLVGFRERLVQEGKHRLSIRFVSAVIDRLTAVDGQLRLSTAEVLTFGLSATWLCAAMIRFQGDTDGAQKVLDHADQVLKRLRTAEQQGASSAANLFLECDIHAARASLYSATRESDRAKRCVSDALNALEQVKCHVTDREVQGLLSGELFVRIGDALSCADPERSGDAYLRAIAALQTFGQENGFARLQLATALQRYGTWLRERGRLEESKAELTRGRDILLGLVEANSSSLMIARNFAMISLQLSSTLLLQHMFSKAEEVLTRPLRVLRQMANENPWDVDRAAEVVSLSAQMALALAGQAKAEAALSFVREVVVKAADLVAHGDNAAEQLGNTEKCIFALVGLASVVPTPRMAISLHEEAMQIGQHWMRLLPDQIVPVVWYMDASYRLGQLYMKGGENDVALEVLEIALEIGEAARRRLGALLKLVEGLCELHKVAGGAASETGDQQCALGHCEQALRLASDLREINRSGPVYARNLVECWSNMARIQALTGSTKEALSATFACLKLLAEMRAANIALDDDLTEVEMRAKGLLSTLQSLGLQGRLSGLEAAAELQPYLRRVEEQLSGTHISGNLVDPSNERRQSTLGSTLEPLKQSASSAHALSTAELPEFADQAYQRELWEAAETLYSKMLKEGYPIKDLGPKIVRCHLNAHAIVSATALKRVEELILQLESAGETDAVARLRQEVDVKLAGSNPKKPWWKVW